MKNPVLQIEQEQTKRLAEIGSYLRQSREQQSMTLEEVAAKTLIPSRLLIAIEEGKISHLPEPVYIQGFIKRFADALGLDGIELANAFPTAPSVQYLKPSWRDLPAAQLKPLHLYLLYMMLIISAVSGLSYLINRPNAPIVTSSDGYVNSANPAATKDLQGPLSQQTGSSSTLLSTGILGGASEASSVVTGKPVRVGMTLTAQSWLRIVADGKTEFEGVLPEGTQRTWMADKQLIVRAGDAGAVLVSFNDGQAKKLGNPGSVEEKTFGSNQSAALPDSLAGSLRDAQPRSPNALSSDAPTF